MAELRTDELTGRRVLFAAGRTQRPSDFVSATPQRESCPFCPGQEDQTPKEIWALRKGLPNTSNWQIRVIPNKYPISEIHELIIETPHHDRDLPDLPLAQVKNVIDTYRQRLEARSQNRYCRYLSLFKNYGPEAGATRAHPHAQLVGLPFIPALVQTELRLAHEAHRRQGSCIYCQRISRELKSGERIVERDRHLVVWSPYAARTPFECWILPRAHNHDFCTLSPAQMTSLAHMLRHTLLRLRRVLNDFAYNYYVHTAPLPSRHTASSTTLGRSYHWHLEILPRLSKMAGLEWSTGLYVNAMAPEESARLLRDAL